MCAQDGDETVIYDSMHALITLEKLHGLFPRIIGKGDYAGVSIGSFVLQISADALHSALQTS